MKAIRVHTPGGPEALRLEDVPQPAPGSGEVLVKVEAAGLFSTSLSPGEPIGSPPRTS